MSPSDPLKRHYGKTGASEEFLNNYHLLKHPKWYNPLRRPGVLSPLSNETKAKTPYHPGVVHVSKVPVFGRGPRGKKLAKDLATDSILEAGRMVSQVLNETTQMMGDEVQFLADDDKVLDNIKEEGEQENHYETETTSSFKAPPMAKHKSYHEHKAGIPSKPKTHGVADLLHPKSHPPVHHEHPAHHHHEAAKGVASHPHYYTTKRQSQQPHLVSLKPLASPPKPIVVDAIPKASSPPPPPNHPNLPPLTAKTQVLDVKQKYRQLNLAPPLPNTLPGKFLSLYIALLQCWN
jgi:hypothetical protein